jgi:hypothetical protein
MLAYTESEVDFVVAYIIRENAWYVLPVGEVMGHKSLRVRPRGCSGEHPAPTTGTRGTYWASRVGLPTEENLDFIRY